ncbi:MAG TPA: MBL fold metallo-hydrolase [Candidatus Paceibacterota bacterium]|jgi:competence protein ComEC
MNGTLMNMSLPHNSPPRLPLRGRVRPYVLIPFIITLALLDAWMFYLVGHPSRDLEVHFLDVGQGDAILIETPGGVDVLIDGGPDRSVLRALPKKLGLFDRHIDMVIATHPDKDHVAGLIDTLDRYHVSYFMGPGIAHDSSYADALTEAVESEPGLTAFVARRGMRIHLGEGIYADVLFPDRDVTNVETNEGSITLRLTYGETSFLMAGDVSSTIEDYLVTLDGEALQSDVLKASHHGSRHSTSAAWINAVRPAVFVVSAGKGNSYGHPAPEVLERARSVGAEIVSTIESGTITFVSDGTHVERK